MQTEGQRKWASVKVLLFKTLILSLFIQYKVMYCVLCILHPILFKLFKKIVIIPKIPFPFCITIPISYRTISVGYTNLGLSQKACKHQKGTCCQYAPYWKSGCPWAELTGCYSSIYAILYCPLVVQQTSNRSHGIATDIILY